MKPHLGVGTLIGAASLLVLALPIGGQETPDEDTSGRDGLTAPSFSRGWRSPLPDLVMAPTEPGMLIGLDYTSDQVQIYRRNGERVGGLRFARTWIDGMAFVNDRFRVLSNFGICAYTLTGERVRQDAGERWCGRRD